jgi:phage terminase small subunit
LNTLTDKQQAFVNEYIIDLNATQAAIRAGYSPDTARQMGAENLSKPYIAIEIGKVLAQRAERTHITQDYVLSRLVEVVERCLDAIPVLDRKGNHTGEWVFNAAGANQALALLAKHTGGFRERVDLTVTDLRERVRSRAQELGLDPELAVAEVERMIHDNAR